MKPTPGNGLPEDLRRLLKDLGASTTATRAVAHGIQHAVSRGPDNATVNVYDTGKVSTGGKASPLREALEEWRIARGGAGRKIPTGEQSIAGLVDTRPRVGTDEAGKGDYFGPLVVAAVRVLGAEAVRELRRIGVRDSKTLSVGQAGALAAGIRSSVGPGNFRVVVLGPREYEKRRSAAGNVNKLLGEINAEICDELRDEVEVFVVDEFARLARSYIEPRLPRGVRLEVRPRAEDDVAVAAASILARARYLEELDALSGEIGFELPRGATHVLNAARRVVEERGPEGLAAVAKVHFGTTERVLGLPENKKRTRRKGT